LLKNSVGRLLKKVSEARRARFVRLRLRLEVEPNLNLNLNLNLLEERID
jgi:hypothetical protein